VCKKCVVAKGGLADGGEVWAVGEVGEKLIANNEQGIVRLGMDGRGGGDSGVQPND